MSDTCLVTTEEEYRQLQEEFDRGNVELDIPRTVARQFYLVTPRRDIKARSGRDEWAAKLSVFTGLLLTPLLIAICLLLIAYYHGWWAAVVIPVVGILWTVIAGFLNPVGPLWTISVATFAALLLYLLGLTEAAISLPALLWVLSLWINRATYIAAGVFLTRLVLASHPAFELLCDHIEIRRISAGEE